MKQASPKVIQISDLVQWYNKDEIELSPKYQRNSVWNETAKAYLIDTIVRGMPIPPIFLRQKIDVSTKATFREVIDGQQRIRAILEYVVDEKYEIRKNHNKNYGGKKFSELEDEIKEKILSYELVAEIITSKDDSEIYNMFARLNSNNVVLNKQEIRNAKFWGEFKVLIYNLSEQYREFFLSSKIISDNEVLRMKDSELINSLVILELNGVVSDTPKSVDEVYRKYDLEFNESSEIEEKFSKVMNLIQEIYKYLNGNYGCFGNKNYFFTLFAVIYKQIFGIEKTDTIRKDIDVTELQNILVNFINEFDRATTNSVYEESNQEYIEFKQLHLKRTTNKQERNLRIKILNSYFERHYQ